MKVIDLYDRSRSYHAKDSSPSSGNQARPLQTLIWYPSLRSPAKKMTVGDYVQLADTEIHFNAPDEKANRWRLLLKTSFDIPLWAVRDAQPTRGPYPVLIYAPSDSSVSWENADLCEYLASHGYVVLASPSIGASTRDMTDDLDGVNAQASDISFLITYAKSLPESDSSEVAVVSWSWGGLSSLFAAARDSHIHALVEMDGSMRYYPGLVQQAGNVHPDQLTIPLLFFTRGDLSLEALAKDDAPAANRVGPNVLNAWIRSSHCEYARHGTCGVQFHVSAQRECATLRGEPNSRLRARGRQHELCLGDALHAEVPGCQLEARRLGKGISGKGPSREWCS